MFIVVIPLSSLRAGWLMRKRERGAEGRDRAREREWDREFSLSLLVSLFYTNGTRSLALLSLFEVWKAMMRSM